MKKPTIDVIVYRPEEGIETPNLVGKPWCATFDGYDGECVPFLCAYFVTEAEARELQRLWRQAVGIPLDTPDRSLNSHKSRESGLIKVEKA